MSGLSPETIFLLIWIAFLVLGLACAFVVLLWAIRSRQFSDQDRARYLPLKSRIPDKESNSPAGNRDEKKRGTRL